MYHFPALPYTIGVHIGQEGEAAFQITVEPRLTGWAQYQLLGWIAGIVRELADGDYRILLEDTYPIPSVVCEGQDENSRVLLHDKMLEVLSAYLSAISRNRFFSSESNAEIFVARVVDTLLNRGCLCALAASDSHIAANGFLRVSVVDTEEEANCRLAQSLVDFLSTATPRNADERRMVDESLAVAKDMGIVPRLPGNQPQDYFEDCLFGISAMNLFAHSANASLQERIDLLLPEIKTEIMRRLPRV